jgi:hypothetical protein
MTAGECLLIIAVAYTVNRSDCMNNVLGGQSAAAGNDGLPSGQFSDLRHDLFAFRQDRWPARAVDGAIHPTSTQQGRVGRIHDGIRSFFGDISRTVKFDCLAVFQEEAGYVIVCRHLSTSYR